jgi:ABC-type amino acid transport substrate-binding protein
MGLAQFRGDKKIRAPLWMMAAFCFLVSSASAGDLAEIRQRGVLRHLGIPYANFVRETAHGLDGLDVELMRLFAAHLGVEYKWVPTSWSQLFGDLTGQKVMPTRDNNVTLIGATAVRGDIIANGLTILDWRRLVVQFSNPTFPTGIWLMARADSSIKPIVPSGDIETDIRRVKKLLAGRSVLAVQGTCLDPNLYGLASTQADIRLYSASENLTEIALAVIKGAAEATLLDVPDALVALQAWPGDIKIIGPISTRQLMGAAVAKSSPELLAAFNRFFQDLRASGAYDELVKRYYPSIYLYLGDFFRSGTGEQ